MKLNLPILDQIANSQHILIAGMGGGFDVFSGLPIYLELEQLGFDVHLANLSFADIAGLTDGEHLTDTLVGVTSEINDVFFYFPEYYLSEWFEYERNEEITIWCFEKTGARPLIENYKTLVRHLEIDCIVLVDGGVDSLMHGDEPLPGTILEDSLSMLAVNELTGVPVRIVACVGLGIEPEVGHTYLFENMAQLIKAQVFRGSCSLIQSMPVYQQYHEAVMYAFERQPGAESVICSSIVAATRGEYGNFHLTKRTQGSILNISPLMSIYWFFDMVGVVEQNVLIPHLRDTHTIVDSWRKLMVAKKLFSPRKSPPYPLP